MEPRDILFIALAVCALVATAFWIWLAWAIIRIFRTTNELIEDFRQRVSAIDEILQTIREKLTSTHTQLSFLTEGLKQLISFFAARRPKRRSSSRASSATDDF